MKYKTLELFSGTKSFSKVAKHLGHSTFTIDIDPKLEPDLVQDIIDLREDQLPYKPDIIWASPPCEAFSVAAIGKNWNKEDLSPKTDKAVLAMENVETTLDLIDQLKPKYWFIENPRGMLRKMPFMQDLHRETVTYCQYGDNRMKPTDIWTNLTTWSANAMCKNGDKCHVAAPRGSRTGTQGIKGARDRGVIPPYLFIQIFASL